MPAVVAAAPSFTTAITGSRIQMMLPWLWCRSRQPCPTARSTSNLSRRTAPAGCRGFFQRLRRVRSSAEARATRRCREPAEPGPRRGARTAGRRPKHSRGTTQRRWTSSYCTRLSPVVPARRCAWRAIPGDRRGDRAHLVVAGEQQERGCATVALHDDGVEARLGMAETGREIRAGHLRPM
jgi:hypothetical protein